VWDVEKYIEEQIGLAEKRERELGLPSGRLPMRPDYVPTVTIVHIVHIFNHEINKYS